MSTLKVQTIQNSAGVEVYTAKAWVKFNSIGTVSIAASGNVSSITDNAVGNFTINFANSLTDASYSISGGVADNPTGGAAPGVLKNSGGTNTANAVSIWTLYWGNISTATRCDYADTCVTVFR